LFKAEIGITSSNGYKSLQLMLTHAEVPHTVTCYTEKYEEDENIVNISVLIVVERDKKYFSSSRQFLSVLT